MSIITTTTKEIHKKHQYIYENGYKVCVICGIAKKEQYFGIELKNKREKENLKTSKWSNVINKQNWYRLLQINNYKERVFTKARVFLVLSQLHPYFNDTLINFLKKKVLRFHTLNTIKDVYRAIYLECHKNDLPITTKELFEVFSSFSKKNYFKVHQDIKNIDSVRRYYWVISKTLNKCNLSNSIKMRCYKMVYNYYNLMRFGMNVGINPITLINSLCYFSIRYVDYNNRQTQEFFEIDNNHLEINKVRQCLKTINQNRLDKKIPDKLKI